MTKKILTKPIKIRKMGSKGSQEITIPREVSSIMGLELGEYVSFDFYMEEDNIDETFFVVHKRDHEVNIVRES